MHGKDQEIYVYRHYKLLLEDDYYFRVNIHVLIPRQKYLFSRMSIVYIKSRNTCLDGLSHDKPDMFSVLAYQLGHTTAPTE